jgi:hypothetical protein
MTTFNVVAKAGDSIVWGFTGVDLWLVQQEAADFVGDQLAGWYEGRDWTGRKAVTDSAMDQCFRLAEGVEQVGPLPNGVVVTIEELS